MVSYQAVGGIHIMHTATVDCLEVDISVRLTRTEMEERRMTGGREIQRSLRQADVARSRGVSRTTAWRWAHALDDAKGDLNALKLRRTTGRPCRLDAAREQIVVELWKNGPQAAGFPEGCKWTTSKFATAIEAALKIRYDPDHVGRIVIRLGLRKKQQRRTRQRPADIRS